MLTTSNKATPKHITGAAVCTPDWFAVKARCARLKRELKANRKLMGV